MSQAPCTIWTIGALIGKRMPELGRRGYCPFRQHRRADKTLSVFRSRSGDVLYKCHSCDPPYNMGDAVQLYAGVYGLDRKTAWHELRDRGYAVPGSDERYSPRRERVPKREPKPVAPRLRVAGEKLERVLHFDQGTFERLAQKDLGATARLAEARGLSAETLRAHDVVDVSDGLVGFAYRDPDTRIVTRVKMRPLDRKTYWIEPKPKKGERGKAVGPLYLAHELRLPSDGLKTYVIITEGEIDALSLKEVMLHQVVSLPDGAGSSARVDIRPIVHGYAVWFVATDNDDEGYQAYRVLQRRAALGKLGPSVVRVVWRMGEQTFKDANEALMGGMQHDDFVACLRQASKEYMGWSVRL